MTLLKGFVRGNLDNIKQQDINSDKLYAIKDMPDNSITNEQMELAVNDNAAAAFFRINNTYICIDEGEYIKNHIYKWLGDSWEDITPVTLVNTGDGSKYLSDDGSYKTLEIPQVELDDTTINRNSENKLQAVGITDGTDIIDYNTLYQAISTKWEV